MSSPPSTSRRFFLLLLAIAAVLFALLVRPFGEVFLFAAVFAGALFPIQKRLSARLRGRKTASAVVIVVLFTLAVLIPTVWVGATLLKEAVAAASSAADAIKHGALQDVTARLPQALQDRLAPYLHPSEEQTHLGQQLADSAGTAVHSIQRVLSSAGTFLVHAGLMLIALVVFLAQGPELLDWLERISPLQPGETQEIFREFRSVTYSVVVANSGTSAVQSLFALAGYLIARMPQPLLATAVTFLASFIPGIGGAGTVVFAAGILFVTGNTGHALFLALWGLFVVGVVDNVVKPLFLKRGVQLQGAVVFFSLVCGLAAFGAPGLLLGPLIVTFTLTLLRIYKRDYDPDPGSTASEPATSARR